MGGSIGVESVYGEGSVFTVRIPQGFVADVPIGAQTVANLRGFRYVESKRSSNEALSDLQLPSARVLVVDDNQTNLAVARGMMKRFGMQVDCVDNGQAAIELINKGKQRYHAIFMDHMMPGMDGIETFERIRALGTAYATSVPVIALTANAISGNAEMFTDKGFAAFLSKPMDIMQLELIIRRWIRDGEAESDSQPQEREQEQLRPRAQEEPQERVQVWPQEQPREQRQPRTQGQQGQAGRPQLQKAPSLSSYSLIAVLGDCGIDVESALERFGGQAEEYLRVLRVYLADTERLLLELNDPSEQELGAYAVVVHGIKGSSRGVGAMRIAREAEELERAAKSGEHELVLRLNEGFVERAQEFIEDASRALDSLGYCEGKEFKESPDAALLEQLCEAAARFSIDGVEDALEALEDYDYQTEGELVAWLRVQCDALAFDEIVVRLSDFGNVGSANAGNARNVSTIRKGESNDYRAAS
jgi:CheY-like chemotaxis protein